MKENFFSTTTTTNNTTTIAATSTTSNYKRQKVHHFFQPSLKEFLPSMKPLHPESEKAKSIAYAVAKMMFVDLRPFSIVEDEGFRQVLKTSEPRYTVPSRTTFRTKVLPALYEECASKVKYAIKSYHEQYGSNTLYSVTTDGWTSSSNILYLSYTLHIPGEGCDITSFGLGTVELPHKRTFTQFT